MRPSHLNIEKILNFTGTSQSIHLYRVFVKANVISFIFRLNSLRSSIDRFHEHFYTYRKHKELEKKIDLSIKKRNATKAWNRGDHHSALKLLFKIIFYWPIYFASKLLILYKIIMLFTNKIYKKYE